MTDHKPTCALLVRSAECDCQEEAVTADHLLREIIRSADYMGFDPLGDGDYTVIIEAHIDLTPVELRSLIGIMQTERRGSIPWDVTS